MSRICRECKRGTLHVLGLGSYEDTIEVECPVCGDGYEIELDGFGEGGLESGEAYDAEMMRREADNVV